MIDLYTKVLLTVIALSLAAIAWQGMPSNSAQAQIGASCGGKINPCYIATGMLPIEMRLER